MNIRSAALSLPFCLITMFSSNAESQCRRPTLVESLKDIRSNYLALKSSYRLYVIDTECIILSRENFAKILLFKILPVESDVDKIAVFIRSYRTFSASPPDKIKVSRGGEWFLPHASGAKPAKPPCRRRLGASTKAYAERSENSASSAATLSRWPLYSPRLIRFERQSGFWHPRWWVPNAPIFQQRVGGRIALVTEARIAGRPLAVYNLHLESRGDDQLRASQLREVLADTMTVPPSTPVIVAGDMNFDTSQPGLVEHSGLCDLIGPHSVPTTPRRLFHSAQAIDRALVRGPVRSEGITVHRSVEASDHYPLSFTLSFD